MARDDLHRLIGLLDEAYFGPAWHGPSLRGALRAVTPAQSLWRPAPGRHNIWELAVHAAYWKYTVRRQVLGLKPGSFAEKGSNWFDRTPAASGSTLVAAWRRDRAALEREHRKLREALLAFPAADLDRKPPSGRHSWRRMIAGVALHDVYHAGQIQLLKRLAGRR